MKQITDREAQRREAQRRASLGANDQCRAYRIPDFCRLYGLGRSTVYKLVKQGRLRLVKVGSRSLILHEDAEALLREGV